MCIVHEADIITRVLYCENVEFVVSDWCELWWLWRVPVGSDGTEQDERLSLAHRRRPVFSIRLPCFSKPVSAGECRLPVWRWCAWCWCMIAAVETLQWQTRWLINECGGLYQPVPERCVHNHTHRHTTRHTNTDWWCDGRAKRVQSCFLFLTVNLISGISSISILQSISQLKCFRVA